MVSEMQTLVMEALTQRCCDAAGLRFPERPPPNCLATAIAIADASQFAPLAPSSGVCTCEVYGSDDLLSS